MYLRQSTASQEILLGPFVDSTDGNTAETALTIANTDILLHKHGGTTLPTKNSGGATHISAGYYYAVLDATDTNTIGNLEVNVHVSGALAVRREYVVLAANVYDALFGTTALATATNITAGTITTATNVTTVNGLAANVITATSIANDAITSAKIAADAIGASELAADAASEIGTAVWATATRVLTANTNLNDPTAAAIADAVLDEALSGHTTAGTLGKAVADIETDATAILADTNELQTDWADAGRLDAILDARASQASVDTIDGIVDSILVDTGTTLDTKLNDIQGATFSSATDSLEAIRDRGDAAWTTGAGGSDRLLMVDTTIATLATQTSFTLTAGSADNDAYNNCTIVVEDASTSTQKAVGMVLDYVGSTKTVTLKEALAFTIATTDKVYILAENSLKSTVANRQLDVTATGAAGIDWGNIENPTTAVDLSATDIQLCDTVTTLTGHTAQTGDTYALANGANGFVAIKGDTAAILTDTAEIGVAGAGLTNINLPDQTMNITGNITGNLSGSVGSVTGNVGGIAGTITTLDALDTAQDTQHSTTQSNIAALNNLSAAQVNAECDTAISDAGLATAASVAALPTAAQNATELLDQAAGVETNRTVRQSLRLMLAAMAGKLSGAATTSITIRDTNDSVDRITATVDSDGNRSAVTYDVS